MSGKIDSRTAKGKMDEQSAPKPQAASVVDDYTQGLRVERALAHLEAIADPIARVHAANDLAEQARDVQGAIGQIRHRAIYEATLRPGHTGESVAAELEVSPKAVSAAVAKFRSQDRRLFQQALEIMIQAGPLDMSDSLLPGLKARDVLVQARLVLFGFERYDIAKVADGEFGVLEEAEKRAREIHRSVGGRALRSRYDPGPDNVIGEGYGTSVTQPHPQTFEFDVALSFAGEDRTYVQQVADQLQRGGVRVFYDEYMAADLWGTDLYVVLDEVYRKRARFAVVFVSRHYVNKPWTRHERQSAQARAFAESDAYLLPVRLDDSELPGLRPTIGYVSARHTTVEQLVTMIEQKLASTPGVTTPSEPLMRVPRTPDEQRELLAQRPPAWEYLLLAGVLWQRREALEPKRLDHELGYAKRTGQHLNNSEAAKMLSNTLRDMESFASTLVRLFDPDIQERAFGAPGMPGNPTRIEHLASRFIGTYEELLDLAAALRGIGVSEEFQPVFEATARLADAPLAEVRDFVDRVVAEADRLPERMKEGKPVTVSLTLVITIGEEDLANLHQAKEQAMRAMDVSS